MIYFFIKRQIFNKDLSNYKQWQRTLKLTSISNLNSFFFGGVGGGGMYYGEFKNGQ